MYCPNDRPILPRRFVRAAALFSLTFLPLNGMTLRCAAAPAYAAVVQDEDDEPGLTATKKSNIVVVELPAGAFRYRGKKEVKQFAEGLAKLSALDANALGEVEVLAWPGGGAAKKEFPGLLKEAGYSYKSGRVVKMDDGTITPFTAERAEGKNKVVAMWMEQGDNLLLAWAVTRPATVGSEEEAEAESNRKPATKPITKSGANVSASERRRLTAELNNALTDGTLAQVEEAIAAGADPDGTDSVGLPLVARAAIVASSGKASDLKKLEVLLDAGADPNRLSTDGSSALFLAALTDSVDVIRLLLDRNADPNVASPEGNTPLHATALVNKENAARLLIERGANVEARNRKGQTPLQFAEQNKSAGVAELLRRADSIRGVAKPARKPVKSEDVVDEAGSTGAITLDVAATTRTVNVMGKTMPKTPAFPNVAKKPGLVRGYVYDMNGKPLKGARIGARSTSAGGFYSGAQGKTDEKGFYEIEVPWGVAHFYNAGYAIEYGEGLAAVGLCPEEGEVESFATTSGAVQNFVLMPYGIADRAAVQDDPQYCGNYYGGNVILGWHVSDGGILASGRELPANSVIEFTLTPDGPLLGGSKARPIIIRKSVGELSFGQLYVNNIPVTTYTISAKLVGGKALKMKEVGPNSGKAFGMEPKETTGKAALLLRASAKADMVVAGKGAWEQICIQLEMP